jgi:hypothetical protein
LSKNVLTIKGRDSLAVKDGLITVNAGADGLQANNDEDLEGGYGVIEGGTISINAGLDGFQAETNLLVSAGTFDSSRAAAACRVQAAAVLVAAGWKATPIRLRKV